MELTIQEIRHKAARGENLTMGELLDIAETLENYDREIERLTRMSEQRGAQVAVLKEMNTIAFNAAAAARTIDEMRECSKEVCSTTGQLFNAFEVRQVINAYDISERQRAALAKTHDQLMSQSITAIGVEQLISDVNKANVHPFSYQDVAALVEMYRSTSSLTRPMRNNVREVFQLLKAQPNALFHGQEVKMVREWGANHDRNLSIVKARLGRAFTDPVGYMDTRFDMMLSKTTKRQLLDGKALLANAYQNAVFTRPDFLKIPEDWKLLDGRTQFHAGEHFHTRATDGLWWCGTHFNDMTGHQLMNILETALGELRLLYIHFPNGVQNEATES